MTRKIKKRKNLEGESPVEKPEIMKQQVDVNDDELDSRFKTKNEQAMRLLKGQKQRANSIFVAHDGAAENEQFDEPLVYQCSCEAAILQAHNRYCESCGRSPDASRIEQTCAFTKVKPEKAKDKAEELVEETA